MINIDREKAQRDSVNQPEQSSSELAPRVSVPGLSGDLANAIAETHPGSSQYLRRASAARVHLSRGRVVLVDPDDAYNVRSRPWQWRRLRSGKVVAYTLDGSSGPIRDLWLHHFLIEVPDDMVVIHRNHDGLDNRRSNLQVVNRSQVYEHSLTRTGYAGVWWDADIHGWVVDELVGDEVVTTGPFAGPDEAVAAQQAARSRAEFTVAAPIDDEHPDAVPTAQGLSTEPQGSVRGVRTPRSNTGYRGVTFDAQNNSYVVRCGDCTSRFQNLADATRAASIAITKGADREAHLGERALKLGRFEVLLDRVTASWLPALGPWRVQQRPNGLLDVRRVPSASDPEADYKTAQDYIAARAPDERIEFLNGDRLDLRAANLRLVPRTQ